MLLSQALQAILLQQGPPPSSSSFSGLKGASIKSGERSDLGIFVVGWASCVRIRT